MVATIRVCWVDVTDDDAGGFTRKRGARIFWPETLGRDVAFCVFAQKSALGGHATADFENVDGRFKVQYVCAR